tara:strand:- start:7331 stop:7534 length:204 start_codon:yes stop_codon:yes gene_type:complete
MIDLEKKSDHLCDHPDMEWAKAYILNKKPDITEEELATLEWVNSIGCYLVSWKGMCLGLETDGEIHS